jgi:hypothetical protein
MPWKIIPSEYDPTDLTTLHDDEMIAMAHALEATVGVPLNENNPRWRALQKVLPLASQCDGTGDPVHLLPPEARTTPVWSDTVPDGQAPSR